MRSGTEHKVTRWALDLMVRVFAKWSALRWICCGRADLASERIAVLLITLIGRAGAAKLVGIDVAVLIVSTIRHATSTTGYDRTRLERLIRIGLALEVESRRSDRSVYRTDVWRVRCFRRCAVESGTIQHERRGRIRLSERCHVGSVEERFRCVNDLRCKAREIIGV